jgi:hypothetical protein
VITLGLEVFWQIVVVVYLNKQGAAPLCLGIYTPNGVTEVKTVALQQGVTQGKTQPHRVTQSRPSPFSR